MKRSNEDYATQFNYCTTPSLLRSFNWNFPVMATRTLVVFFHRASVLAMGWTPSLKKLSLRLFTYRFCDLCAGCAVFALIQEGIIVIHIWDKYQRENFSLCGLNADVWSIAR